MITTMIAPITNDELFEPALKVVQTVSWPIESGLTNVDDQDVAADSQHCGDPAACRGWRPELTDQSVRPPGASLTDPRGANKPFASLGTS